MKTRVISGILVVAITMALVWSGGLVLTIGLILTASIGFVEMTKALGVRGSSEKLHVLELLGILSTAFFYILIWLGMPKEHLILYVLLMLPFFMAITVFTYPKNKTEQAIKAYFSFVYVTVMLGFILLTRNFTAPGSLDKEGSFYNTGFFAAWMIFISAWGSDTCAYFAGVALGKHKAFPKLSPKKSVEGCIGGVVGSGIFGFLYAMILNGVGRGFPGMYWVFPLLGVAGSIISQIGDLSASAIKRDMKIKDYGHIIPGHGGILDRFDSIIFTAPMIYLMVILFIS